MDTPDRITHSMVKGTRPGRARLRSWKDGTVTSVIETWMDWEAGSFRIDGHGSIVHPDHRGHAGSVLDKVASFTGLELDGDPGRELPIHDACRVVDDGRIVVWASHGDRGTNGYARELTMRGPVVGTDAPFTRQRDRDGVVWMTIAIGIVSPFPRRGAIQAMYDMVEKASGTEMRPMGWNGMGGGLNDERIYTLWRKRLALQGIDVDEGLRPDILARTRDRMPSDKRDDLDLWVREAIDQFENGNGAPTP